MPEAVFCLELARGIFGRLCLGNQVLDHVRVAVLARPKESRATITRKRFVDVDVGVGQQQADDLGVAAAEHKRLPQGEQSLEGVYRSRYMFN